MAKTPIHHAVNTADAGVGAADYALRRREQAMREPIDACITAVEKNANKMARVSNRSSPLMETLGGFAIVGGLMYGGYSVVAMGAQPGQFFSFLTAFLLAYEPAKRLGGSISN